MKWMITPVLALSFSSAFAMTQNVKNPAAQSTPQVVKGVEDPSGFVPIEYHNDPVKRGYDKPTSPAAVEDEAGFVKINYLDPVSIEDLTSI